MSLLIISRNFRQLNIVLNYSEYFIVQALYNNYDKRLDVENAQTFEKNDFMGACKAMGITERLDNA